MILSRFKDELWACGSQNFEYGLEAALNLGVVTCGFRWQVLLAQSSHAPIIRICPYCMGWWTELPATCFHSVFTFCPECLCSVRRIRFVASFLGKPSEGLLKNQSLIINTKDQQGMFWIQASLRNWVIFAESLGKRLSESWVSEMVVVCASACRRRWLGNAPTADGCCARCNRTASNLC